MHETVTVLGWTVAIIEALVMIRMIRMLREAPKEKLIEKVVEVPVEVEKIVRMVEREIPDEIHEMAKLADATVLRLDGEKQSGEWKFHQAYAALVKSFKLPPKMRQQPYVAFRPSHARCPQGSLRS